RWSVYYGEGRDAYDVPGRVAHESIFNVNDGAYRCPSTQQGYSPFTTWTRGLAWAILGFAEELEYLGSLPPSELAASSGAAAGGVEAGAAGAKGVVAVGGAAIAVARRALDATCAFYVANSAADGVPYWDTGAPGLAVLGPWRERPADPFNAHEPVDSSAAAIACQGFLRYGAWLTAAGDAGGKHWLDVGYSLLATLLEEPYLNGLNDHHGLLLHSVYHRPNGWDHVPPGRSVPCGESSMWGDYHLREAALCAQRMIEGGTPLVFWRRRSV
ncbi:MAG TPA: glycosyl hydrolase, partial [Spirochaetia bacterium]